MDNLRGHFPDHGGPDGYETDDELDDDETGRELPPAAIGQDERRMQVRAYNFWASLLLDRNLPSIESLDPECLPDFGPFSVLLDFTNGIDNPAIAFLGDQLAAECDADTTLKFLSDVPSRSLLSRITDHYMQIIANQAPIGFEAEFVNQRGETILYRGILLPFSSNDETIDFIYGVINWKQLADQQTTDELLLQIDQALDTRPKPQRDDAPLTEWADGPADISDRAGLDGYESPNPAGADFPAPEFGLGEDRFAIDGSADTDLAAQPRDLADWLASARELAQLARGSEERSRKALYAAIGRAHDFAIAAADAPEEFAEMVSDAGLTVQDRAPMTPLVKLVFGADYDKTRLAEYAAVLGHAERREIGRGELSHYLASVPGGLKGIVVEERRHRRAESGKPQARRDSPRSAIANKLRDLTPRSLAELPREGNEFTVLVARRLSSGEVVVLGEVSDDVALVERASKQLLNH